LETTRGADGDIAPAGRRGRPRVKPALVPRDDHRTSETTHSSAEEDDNLAMGDVVVGTDPIETVGSRIPVEGSSARGPEIVSGPR
jgi:hypothetical protein